MVSNSHTEEHFLAGRNVQELGQITVGVEQIGRQVAQIPERFLTLSNRLQRQSNLRQTVRSELYLTWNFGNVKLEHALLLQI